jgi:hypothetical protein
MQQKTFPYSSLTNKQSVPAPPYPPVLTRIAEYFCGLAGPLVALALQRKGRCG